MPQGSYALAVQTDDSDWATMHRSRILGRAGVRQGSRRPGSVHRRPRKGPGPGCRTTGTGDIRPEPGTGVPGRAWQARNQLLCEIGTGRYGRCCSGQSADRELASGEIRATDRRGSVDRCGCGGRTRGRGRGRLTCCLGDPAVDEGAGDTTERACEAEVGAGPDRGVCRGQLLAEAPQRSGTAGSAGRRVTMITRLGCWRAPEAPRPPPRRLDAW